MSGENSIVLVLLGHIFFSRFGVVCFAGLQDNFLSSFPYENVFLH